MIQGDLPEHHWAAPASRNQFECVGPKICVTSKKKKRLFPASQNVSTVFIVYQADSRLVRMSTKLAPNKITDSDKTKISNGNVCRHYRVGYCKCSIACRHKHIKEECEVKDCNKKCIRRHIKTCRYGAKCKRISDCEFKHVEKEQYSVKHKLVEKRYKEKGIIEARLELESLQTEVNELKIKIDEQKILLNDASLHKENIIAENFSLKQEMKLLNVKISKQQEEIFKSKIEIIKVTEEKENILHQFQTDKDKIDKELDFIRNNETAKEVNPLDIQTKTDINKTQKQSTEQETVPIQRLKSVSPTVFFEKNYEMFNKEEHMKTPQCAKCGEQFVNQKSFFNHVLKEHNAAVLVARKYLIKTDKNHPDHQEGGGMGQGFHKGTGLPGQF